MELTTPRLILRDFRSSDWAALREIESRQETYYYESVSPSVEKTDAYLQQAQLDALQSPRTRYRLAVTIRPQDQMRGRVTLGLINDSIREWEIGWAIHPAEWGKGIATQAARRMLDFGFTELRAHRVVAFSHVHNAASLRVMQKLGMQKEGLLRETRPWGNGWSDEVVCSILDWEWVVGQACDQD